MKRLQKMLLALVSKFDIITQLALKNMALRQQLIVLRRSCKRPHIRRRDRFFWMLLSHLWGDWKESLIMVKPQTVIKWNRKGFKLFWRIKNSLKMVGRSRVSPEIRTLVRSIAEDNPLWGAPRIHGELLKLGIEISERSVSNLMPSRRGKPPSQTWRTFLKNHMYNTVSLDLFTVPTITFKILFVMVILIHERWKVFHFNVTRHPTARWSSRQIVEAFPWDTAPKYLLRDWDAVYGSMFRQRVKNMGINEVMTAPQSPWQNPYVERLIGSIRRECLDHVIVLNEKHLKRILKDYFDYYHNDRTHLGLEKKTPIERSIQRKSAVGKLIELPRVGGLHHRYMWKEAA